MGYDAADLWRDIQNLAAASGKIQKMSILQDILDSDLGNWVVKMTYDPFITYGVKPPMPRDIEAIGSGMSFRKEFMEKTLEALASRELTGSDAKQEVQDAFAALDESGREILWRILSKDLKAGVGTTLIAAVKPDLVPAFAVMRAHTYEERHVKTWPRKGEFKLDGQRNTFLYTRGRGGFFTRSGKPVPALDFFVPNLVKVAGQAALDKDLAPVLLNENGRLAFMLDGEAMMGLFEDTGALRRKEVDARDAELHLYDIMSYADFDAMGSVGKPLSERRELLSKFVRIAKEVLRETDTPDMVQIVPQYYLNSHEEVEKFFRQARTKTLASYLARGNHLREKELLKTTIDKGTGKPKVLEGIMVKDPDGLYDKKKSRGWLKMKAEETEDLRVIGAYPGEPGTKYEKCLGGVIVLRDGVQVRVGGGFTDAEREALWDLFEKDLHKFDATNIEPAHRGSGHAIDLTKGTDFEGCKLLGRLIEVEFHEVTPDGSLRHPRFIRFRDDKDGELESKEIAA